MAGRTADHLDDVPDEIGMERQGLPSDHWTDLFLAWVDDLT